MTEDWPEAECPICGTVAPAFEAGGHPERPRPDCQCPTCGSLERHRGFWLFYRERTTLFTEDVRLLHIGPEACLERAFRTMPNVDYLSGDLDHSKAMMQLDLTKVDLPDSSFDFVHASHVLEHIPDDVAAMRELRRILRPGGTALLAVPMWGDETREDLSITDPDERRRLYGQVDHVRMYGRDGTFESRLRTAGFDVVSDPIVTDMKPALRRRFRVRGREPIFRCT